MKKWSDVQYKDSDKTYEPRVIKNPIVYLSNSEIEGLAKFISKHRYLFNVQVHLCGKFETPYVDDTLYVDIFAL